MSKALRSLRYVAAFLVFLTTYALAATVARFLVAAINSDLAGWLAIYVVPYFVAGCAGALGVFGALAAIEYLFPDLRARILTKAFVALWAVIWVVALVGLFFGPADEGLLEMAVQSVAAVIAAMKLTDQDKRQPVR